MGKCKSCMSQFLEAISVGKYHTVLYSKGKNTHTSVVGGWLTITFTLLFLYFVGMTIRGLVRQDHFNLDYEGQHLAAHEIVQSVLTFDMVQCDQPCARVSVRSLIPLIAQQGIFVHQHASVWKAINCSEFTVQLYFLVLNSTESIVLDLDMTKLK